MLVTDAMPGVGSDAATFELQGRTIRREGDILRGADGVLAGSTLTMAGAVANMIAQGRVSLRTAVTMASATPAAFLGLAARTGTLAAGFAAHLVLANAALPVERTQNPGQIGNRVG